MPQQSPSCKSQANKFSAKALLEQLSFFASLLLGVASLNAMASNLEAMASNLLAMASNLETLPACGGCCSVAVCRLAPQAVRLL